MSFDPDKYLKKKSFDPDKFLAKKTKPEESERLAAGLVGFTQGISLGTADNAAAAIEATLKELYELAGGPESDWKETYTKIVKEKHKEIDRLAEKHPEAYWPGEVVSLLIPGLGLAKAAKGVGSISKVAGTANKMGQVNKASGLAKGANWLKTHPKSVLAGTGAVEGAGRADPEDALAGAATGAALGTGLGVVPGVAKKLGKVATKSSPYVAGLAASSAMGPAGFIIGYAGAKQARDMLMKGSPKSQVLEMLQKKGLDSKQANKVLDSLNSRKFIKQAEESASHTADIKKEFSKLKKQQAQKKKENIAAEKKKTKLAQKAKKKKQKAQELQAKIKKQLKKKGVAELEQRAKSKAENLREAEKASDRAWAERIDLEAKEAKELDKLRNLEQKSAQKFAKQADKETLKKNKEFLTSLKKKPELKAVSKQKTLVDLFKEETKDLMPSKQIDKLPSAKQRAEERLKHEVARQRARTRYKGN